MRGKGRGLFIALYLLPAALFYGLFVMVPFAQTAYLSTFNFSGLSSNRRSVGGRYYSALMRDEVFLQAIKNIGFILVIGGLAVIIIGLLMGHAVQIKGRLGGFLRAIYLFPQVISVVAVAVIWQFMYARQGGLILGGGENGWLGDTKTALPAVTIAWIWFAVGFYIMLFSAGIKNIPQEVHEASELEGCHGWTKFTKVTWPLLFQIRKIAIMYVVINVMNIFALVNVMTDGGPDRHTESLLTYLYETAFRSTKMGYASALAVVNFFIIIVIAMIINWLYRRDPQEGRA